MIAIVILLEVLAICAHLALPLVRTFSLRAEAATITRDLQQVRNAAAAVHARGDSWPADEPPGKVPTELQSHLPPGFRFAHQDYQLDWESWKLPENSEVAPGSRHLAGIAVITHDARVASSVAAQLRPGQLRFTIGNRTTLVIEETSAGTP